MAGKRNRKRSSNRREDYKRRDDKMEQRSTCEDRGRNDISWYSRYPNLLLAAGSFPFPYRPGMKLPLGQITGTGLTGSVTANPTIPGVMSLSWIPSLGTSNLATDPASVVAKEIYAKVRQKYAGSLEADAPDFVVYLTALDSIFTYLAWLKRLYRVLTVWTPENYALPDQVLHGMGLGLNSIVGLRQNRTQLWQLINELVLQSRKFMCPAVMDLFNRHYWMSDNVYTDAGEINSQFFMFSPYAVYQYADLPLADGSGNTGAGLKLVRLPQYNDPAGGSAVSVEDLHDFGLSLINALVAWDDCYTINGYLMRAYEGAPVFIVDELPADQPFNPVYVEEVLAQIENSRCVPLFRDFQMTTSDLSGFNVTQNPLTNAVVSNPTYVTYGGKSGSTVNDTSGEIDFTGYAIPPVISVRSQTPTVADSTIASRLQAVVTVTAGTSTTQGIPYTVKVSCGTEIPLQWWLIDATVSEGGQYVGARIPQTPTYFVDTAGTLDPVAINNMVNAMVSSLRVEQFDWHPFIFATFIRTLTGNKITGSTRIVGDTHNITTITPDDLRNLHKICIYSELNAFSA